jgi:uncharacterized protein DUF4336
VWIVDGPSVKFGFGWPKLPFTTRMTLVRMGSKLFVHSPTELTESLQREIAALGTVAWLVEPNRIHYSWVTPWQRAYPSAEVFLAPKIDRQVDLNFAYSSLTIDHGYPWDECIKTLPITSAFMTELEFFHIPSRTLILTDLIENFEPDKLTSFATKMLTRLAGVTTPHGGMPGDMKLTFLRRKPELLAAVEKMIAWDPVRIIISHGRWFEADGADELRHAFGWLLQRSERASSRASQ